jgi:hypothetical protein
LMSLLLVLMCDIPRLICLGILRPGAKCSWPVKTPKPGFGNDSIAAYNIN